MSKLFYTFIKLLQKNYPEYISLVVGYRITHLQKMKNFVENNRIITINLGDHKLYEEKKVISI